MAECILMKSGGVDLDVVTAAAGDVVAPKVIVGPDGEPIIGTMTDRGNWNGSVGMNGSVTVPAGRHGGGGKVSGPAVTQRGAWTSRLGANGKVVVPEGYHNGKGYVDQALSMMGAQTINPGTTAKTLSCNGKYMTGNVTVPAISIPAAYIKRGQRITLPDGSSVTGTWEGYVGGPTDLYYNGVNNAGFTSTDVRTKFDSNQITYTGNSGSIGIASSKAYNLTGYSRIVCEGWFANNAGATAYSGILRISDSKGGATTELVRIRLPETGTNNVTFTFNTQVTKYLDFTFLVYGNSYIRRIYLA